MNPFRRLKTEKDEIIDVKLIALIIPSLILQYKNTPKMYSRAMPNIQDTVKEASAAPLWLSGINYPR